MEPAIRDHHAVRHARAGLDLPQDARHHRHACDLEQRLRLVERERIEPRREASGEEHRTEPRRWRRHRRRKRAVTERAACSVKPGTLRLVAARVQDRATRPWKLRARPVRAPELDQRAIRGGDLEHLAAKVEVPVYAGDERGSVTRLQRGAPRDGVRREFLHHGTDRVIAPLEPLEDGRVHIARTRAWDSMPRKQQRGKQGRIDPLDGALRERLAEVHREKPLVRLDEPVERTSADPEHLVLRAPCELSDPHAGESEPVPRAPRAERRDEDRARAREPSLERDVALDRCREGAACAIDRQHLPARAQQVRFDRNRSCIPQRHPRLELAYREAETAPSVEVRGIAEQSHAGVCAGDGHGGRTA